jgi:hypothetical protein
MQYRARAQQKPSTPKEKNEGPTLTHHMHSILHEKEKHATKQKYNSPVEPHKHQGKHLHPCPFDQHHGGARASASFQLQYSRTGKLMMLALQKEEK